MNLVFVACDVVVAIVALRALAVLRGRSPWTTVGWAATAVYCATAAVEFSRSAPSRGLMLSADAFFGVLLVAFIVAGIRDEAPAEPFWWPTRIGLTRAQKR